MAYVRAKKLRNKKTGAEYEYFQLVESRWEDGKPRQKVLMHLGSHPTPDALYAALEAEADLLAGEHNELLRQRKNLKRRLGKTVARLEGSEESGEAPTREQIREFRTLQERLWSLGDEIEEKGRRYDDTKARQETVYPYLSDERKESIERQREVQRRFGLVP